MVNDMTHIGIGIRIGQKVSGISGPDGTPSGLTLTVISDTEIQLDWTAGSTNHDGTSIEISTDGVTYTETATVTAPTVHYHKTGLTAGTLYYFRVREYKGTNYSAYSNVASATSYEALTITQKTRIEGDGGTIIDLVYMNTAIKTAKGLAGYASLKLLSDTNFAIRIVGSKIDKIYDISGNNNDLVQTTDSARPGYSVVGGKTLATYGTDIFMAIPYTSLNMLSSQTWIGAGKTTNNASCNPAARDNGSTSRNFSWEAGSQNPYFITGASAVGANAGIQLTNNVAGIFSARFTSGSKVEGWLNGVTGTPVNTANVSINDVTLDYSIGARYTGASVANPFPGQIYSFFAYSSAITNAERITMEGVINAYYTIY